ncbi:hypothetical protein C9374_010548 [Naegleria lovaniensis]|uniref:Uncharacterized protein n=1 Tax=Naegleria lovaniensis TaxID=51637 RepID=A0AA88GHS9_NAELO|nr:uncharacterized protein C9374_010548 [Naegleria lovaniensis]KAG2374804.1 hypothetical protein C9374_010548 [Naegleria lovaniensis]
MIQRPASAGPTRKQQKTPSDDLSTTSDCGFNHNNIESGQLVLCTKSIKQKKVPSTNYIDLTRELARDAPLFEQQQQQQQPKSARTISSTSRPSSASSVNRIYRNTNTHHKELDKEKSFLRISTSPLPFSRPTSASPSIRPASALSARSNTSSVVSIAKNSNTSISGVSKKTFRGIIEQNYLTKKKGRAPYHIDYSFNEEDEEDDDNSDAVNVTNYGHNNKQQVSTKRATRPRSASSTGTQSSNRPWSASSVTSTRRGSKKSRITTTETPSSLLDNPTTAALTTPPTLSHYSLPTSSSIQKRVDKPPNTVDRQNKFNTSSTTALQQHRAQASPSVSSLKKTNSKNDIFLTRTVSFKSICDRSCESESETDSDDEEDIIISEISKEQPKLLSRTASVTSVGSLQKSTTSDSKQHSLSRTNSSTSINSSSLQRVESKKSLTISVNNTPTDTPTNKDHASKSNSMTKSVSSPLSKNSPNMSSFKKFFGSPRDSDFSFGDESDSFIDELNDAAAVLKTHILALPKTKKQKASQSQKSSNVRSPLKRSPTVKNDFLLSRNKVVTDTFVKAVEKQNKPFTDLIKDPTNAKSKIGVDSSYWNIDTDLCVQNASAMVQQVSFAPVEEESTSFNNFQNHTEKINLQLPCNEESNNLKKCNNVVIDTRTTYISGITHSVNSVLNTWSSNIETTKEKEEAKVVINDTQAIEHVKAMRESIEMIHYASSPPSKKHQPSRNTSLELSKQILQKDPSFFGFEVSEQFISDLKQKVEIDENVDDITNLIRDYKEDISKSKKAVAVNDSSDSENEKPKVPDIPLNVGKEKRMKVNQKILNERIADIKKYSWKYAELEKRVKEIKKEMKEKEKKLNIEDFVKKNADMPLKTMNDVRNNRERVIQRQAFIREQAVLKFNEQERHRCEELDRKFEEKEKRRQNATSEKMSKVYKQTMWKLQKTWFPIVKIGLFISAITEPLLSERVKRKRETDEKVALFVMRKRLLPYILKRRDQKQQAALQVIRKNWLIYVINFRVRRKKKAVNVIERFVQDINKTNRMVRAVSRFINAVKKIQRFIKKFLFRRRLHLHMLNQQYKRLEMEFTKNQAKQDIAEVKFKIVDVLKKVKETAFFEEPSTATESRAIHRRQQHAPHVPQPGSGWDDDTSGIRRTKLAVSEAKKTLRHVQKFVIDELKEQIAQTPNIPQSTIDGKMVSPRSSKKGPIMSHAETILKQSERWVKGLDDFPYLIHIIENNMLKNQLVLKLGRMLRITPTKRCHKTSDAIRTRIIREDLTRRMHQIRFEELEIEKRKEKAVQALQFQKKMMAQLQKQRSFSNRISLPAGVTTSELLAEQLQKQNSILQEEAEIENERNELLKKKSIAYLPQHAIEILVRKGLEETLMMEKRRQRQLNSPRNAVTSSNDKQTNNLSDSFESRMDDFDEYEEILDENLN